MFPSLVVLLLPFVRVCKCTLSQNYASSDSSVDTVSSVEAAEFDRFLQAESVVNVTVPLDLDKAEEILMQYSSEEWGWMDIRVDPFNVPGRVDSNLQIFLRMFTNLILKSETVFQPTPSGLFYEFRTFGQTSLNKTQLLKRCEFAGRMFGTAARRNYTMDLPIPRAFYKLVIHGSNNYVTLDDIELVDQRAFIHLYKLRAKIMETSAEIDFPFRTLPYEYVVNGKTKSVTYNLSDDAFESRVTRANFYPYTRRYVDWVLFGRAKEELRAFCVGFMREFPRDALQRYIETLPMEVYILRQVSVTDYQDKKTNDLFWDAFRLEEAIRGKGDIDINDWAAFTEYKGYVAHDHVVERFWTW
ncbi:MAG: hypothetical protein SGCHY_002792, partial [Lobulomycetales sp.]